ncbi:P-loop NTPase fold protein [Chryseolinea lacunae]|uniref:KAP NTPase domain-containing protein n=1 Tax=Chryseolinea lacunae TaxID=2801331 RepID=A0ABS1L4J7_9BACT|nr:P-loop NTPase fold protein [Chryseolinea lacunae]MBL0745491.1 hypothetical protein [Chryseolinea lacunae]
MASKSSVVQSLFDKGKQSVLKDEYVYIIFEQNERIEDVVQILVSNKFSVSIEGVPGESMFVVYEFDDGKAGYALSPDETEKWFKKLDKKGVVYFLAGYRNVNNEYDVFVDWPAARIPVAAYTSVFDKSKIDVVQEGTSLGGKVENLFLLEESTNFKFRNDTIKPALNVKIQSAIFFKLIESMFTSESGLLLGIFGRWGRGKTFFWNHLVADLLNDPNRKYEHLEFHAWKYQDTPASWAYLYEIFVTTFYRRSRRILGFEFVFVNRIVLNFARLGMSKFLFGLCQIAFGIVWYFVLSFATKLDGFVKIVSYVGISTLLSSLFFYYRYSGLAIDLFRSYFAESTFTSVLGMQAEIQKELIILLRTWIPDKHVGLRRIVLFVDDVDRCGEDRIIQIIDSLKIMMDDRNISSRVIVIAAIDEAVLKRAINAKYFKMIDKDLNLGPEAKIAELERLCREYMDKLFINGFKLGVLSSEDKLEVLKNLTEDQTFFREENISISNVVDVVSENKEREKRRIPNLESYTSLLPDKNFEIMDYELSFLREAVEKYKKATPRSIRIFYYRYLLAKAFKDAFIKRNSAIFFEWNYFQNEKAILPYLIVEYSGNKSHQDLLDMIDSIAASKEGVVEISSLNRSFSLSKELCLLLLKIVEVVAPY